jgi:hypothetical protein
MKCVHCPGLEEEWHGTVPDHDWIGEKRLFPGYKRRGKRKGF